MDDQDTGAERIVTHISRSRPVARKDYQCWACQTKIFKGTKHNKVIVKDETGDAFLSVRMHFRCEVFNET